MTQGVIGARFLITSVTITLNGKWRKLRHCVRIINHLLRNTTGVLKDNDVVKIGDKQKLIESGSGENDDSNIRYYCTMEELFDVLETAHINAGHKRTRGKTLFLFLISKIFSL